MLANTNLPKTFAGFFEITFFTRKSPRCMPINLHHKSNSPPRAERHRWKIQRKAACFQAIVRGLFEDLRGYNFSCIAVQIKFRSTLKTSGSLEWRASARPRARNMRREQRALVKIFPVCRVLWYFLSHRKYIWKDYRKNIRQLNKVKNCEQVSVGGVVYTQNERM